ncbi:FadR/GntR family transcriptional regulator [uncultured Albimonas sp.]|uniref:FadR/GntR family transcriptional regulator n=1 Tax=uncultured Albimonas sp. TaxID=1331701 RepID=UPI0030ED5FBB
MTSPSRSPTRAPGRKSLTAGVIEALRAEILSGALTPGDKLPTEPALISRFGVSRTVIREAVAELRADRLVESRHGVGVFVLARPDPEPAGIPLPAFSKISDMIEELELRAAVEIEAAGLAAQRASPAQEAEIEDSHRRFAAQVRQRLASAEADYAFHIAIARATNNPRFEAFLSQLGRRTIPREQLRESLGAPPPAPDLARLESEHRKVAEAISRHDPATARAAMRAHLLGSADRYRSLARLAAAAERGEA